MFPSITEHFKISFASLLGALIVVVSRNVQLETVERELLNKLRYLIKFISNPIVNSQEKGDVRRLGGFNFKLNVII